MFEGLFQPSHLLVILVICILVFGPKRLPEMGKAIGDGIRSLKQGMNPDSPTKPEDKEPKG
jgi:sec-independent protein translocase protein TatA